MTNRSIWIAILVLIIASSAALADDLSARALVFVQQGSQWEVRPQVGVHLTSSAAYRVTLEH